MLGLFKKKNLQTIIDVYKQILKLGYIIYLVIISFELLQLSKLRKKINIFKVFKFFCLISNLDFRKDKIVFGSFKKHHL